MNRIIYLSYYGCYIFGKLRDYFPLGNLPWGISLQMLVRILLRKKCLNFAPSLVEQIMMELREYDLINIDDDHWILDIITRVYPWIEKGISNIKPDNTTPKDSLLSVLQQEERIKIDMYYGSKCIVIYSPGEIAYRRLMVLSGLMNRPISYKTLIDDLIINHGLDSVIAEAYVDRLIELRVILKVGCSSNTGDLLLLANKYVISCYPSKVSVTFKEIQKP